MNIVNFDFALANLFNENHYIQPELPPIPKLSVGQNIIHKNFGKGVVIGVYKDKCDILFDSGLIKSLLSRFANFKLI